MRGFVKRCIRNFKSQTMLVCPECGEVNLRRNRYCYACGLELDDEIDHMDSIWLGMGVLWLVVTLFSLIAVMYWYLILSFSSHNNLDMQQTLKVTGILGLIWMPVLTIYMAPALFGRFRSDAWKLFWMNLGFGWTIVGWFAVMMKANDTDEKVVYQSLIADIRDLEYVIGETADAIRALPRNDVARVDINTLQKFVEKAWENENKAAELLGYKLTDILEDSEDNE